jgi:small subunit ribosomal protein S2
LTATAPAPARAQDPENRRATITKLLEAGVHFGHQKKRWNPKMRPYIFSERNGIHIIDLEKTAQLLDEASERVADATRRGGRILFVGTKKQAQDVIKKEADRSGQFYVNQRWLGGTLTNFVTIRARLRYMRNLEAQFKSGGLEHMPKIEQTRTMHELEKLQRMLGGLREMDRLPAIVFVIDPKREQNAIAEALRLGVPVMGMVDTNCDPDQIDHVIPANDDAIRSIRAIVARIANAALEGRGLGTAEADGLTFAEMLEAPPAVDVDESDEAEATETPAEPEA